MKSWVVCIKSKLRTNYARAEMWKAEKSRLKYVQQKSANQKSGRAFNRTTSVTKKQKLFPNSVNSEALRSSGTETDIPQTYDRTRTKLDSFAFLLLCTQVSSEFVVLGICKLNERGALRCFTSTEAGFVWYCLKNHMQWMQLHSNYFFKCVVFVIFTGWMIIY